MRTDRSRPEPVPRPKGRLLLASGIGLLVGAGLFALFRQPDELEAYKAQLRSRGELLSLPELLPAQSPEVIRFNQRVSAEAVRLVRSPLAGSIHMISTGATPGVAQAAWKQPTPPGLVGANNSWAALGADLDQEEATLQNVRELLAQRPSGTESDAHDPLNSPTGIKLVLRRKMALALAGAVLVNLQRGRLDPALTNLHALLALAQHYDPGGILVDRMIQVAVAGLAINVTREALRAPGWDADQLRSLQAEWERLDPFSGYVRTVEMERAQGRAYYQVARTNNNPGQMGLELSLFDSTNALAEFVNDSLYAPLWKVAWSKGDELVFLQTMQPVLEAARVAATNRSYRAQVIALDAAQQGTARLLSGINRYRFQVAAQVIPAWRKATLALMRTETHRQLTLSVLALRRYRLAFNRLPETLRELVPAYLSAEPWDFMNGEKLHYQPLPGKQARLYSVGENGRDEQGRGDDLIWPEEEVVSE